MKLSRNLQKLKEINYYSPLEENRLKKAGFECIDIDTFQWMKKITKTRFLIYEKGHLCDIDLNNYDMRLIKKNLIPPYYNSVKEIGKNRNLIIAEIIAETECRHVWVFEKGWKTSLLVEAKNSSGDKLIKIPCICSYCGRKSHKIYFFNDEILDRNTEEDIDVSYLED